MSDHEPNQQLELEQLRGALKLANQQATQDRHSISELVKEVRALTSALSQFQLTLAEKAAADAHKEACLEQRLRATIDVRLGSLSDQYVTQAEFAPMNSIAKRVGGKALDWLVRILVMGALVGAWQYYLGKK